MSSKPRISQGLGKIHEETQNRLPHFHPAPSTISTPNYKLAKRLLQSLTPLTANEYNVIDSFYGIKRLKSCFALLIVYLNREKCKLEECENMKLIVAYMC